MMIFIHGYLKFLFLMTPFFVLSMFLAMTPDWQEPQKRNLALRIGFSVMCVCLALLFFGKWIFEAFGITLDSFRIGGGALLFLSAIGLVNSNVMDKKQTRSPEENQHDVAKIAVVPLAIPVTVGPATIAALTITSAEAGSITVLFLDSLALIGASGTLAAMLFVSAWMEQKVGRNMIIILSKLTGLILAAMAAQMIFQGIKGFFPNL